MKKLFTFIIILFSINKGFSQVAFWTENFGTNPVCASISAHSSNPSGNGIWTVVNSGTNDLFANEWYVSSREAGMAVGNCGDGCVSTPVLINRSLHISVSSSLGGDIGAAYGAGPGIANTDRRAESPTIDCTGKSGISLSYNYIMWGIVNQDFMQVYYSPDNGANWSSLGIPPQTPTVTCSGQGIWTNHTVNLPASANNNPLVKVAFRWQNISTSGADPSCAVDDVTLLATTSSSVVLVPTFSLQNAICKNDSLVLVGNTGTTTATGYTWTALPSGVVFATPNASSTVTYFNAPGTVSVTLTAAAGTLVASVTHTIKVNPTPTISVVSSTLNVCIGQSATLTASGASTYTFNPGNLTGSVVVVSPTINTIYSITGTDTLGCKSTTMASISASNCVGGSTGINSAEWNENQWTVYPNPLKDKMVFKVGITDMSNVKMTVTDLQGKKVIQNNYNTLQSKTEQIIDISNLQNGVYFINVSVDGINQKPIKVVKE